MKLSHVLLVFIGLLMGVFGALSSVQAYVGDSGQGTSTYQGKFVDQYYRANKSLHTGINVYSVVERRTFLTGINVPKGTILAGRPQNSQIIGDLGSTMDVSYHLKENILNHLYGTNALHYRINLPTAKVTQVKQPVYAVKMGNGEFFSGGAQAAQQSQENKNNQVKITSDGYLEYYKYDPQTYGPSGLYTKTLGMEKSNYAKRPNASEKIRYAYRSGSSLYLYFSHQFPGLKDKRVILNGRYRYRLTVTNVHQAVTIGDTRYNDVPHMQLSSRLAVPNFTRFVVKVGTRKVKWHFCEHSPVGPADRNVIFS